MKRIRIFLLACMLSTAASMPAGGAIAQSGQESGKVRYGQPGFVGEKINLAVSNVDLRDILEHITKRYGVEFVLDSSIREVRVSFEAEDRPWDRVLDEILAAKELGAEVHEGFVRIKDLRVKRQ